MHKEILEYDNVEFVVIGDYIPKRRQRTHTRHGDPAELEETEGILDARIFIDQIEITKFLDDRIYCEIVEQAHTQWEDS